MPTGVVIALVVTVLLVCVAVFLLRRLAALRARRLAEADAALRDQSIRFRHDGANLFGIESLGRVQIRGNGVLTITDACLHFLMWVPRRELRVDAGAVTGVETVRSHLGKTVFRDLLKVRFATPDGGEDSAAWLATPLAEARSAAEALLAGRPGESGS